MRRREFIAGLGGRASLDAKLDAIKREIEVLSAHCTAGDDEMRAAVKDRGQALRDAEAAVRGASWRKFEIEDNYRELAARLRRLRS
jgi:hypothetical protein